MADNAEFFDILYQQWSQTTWADKAYWMPVEVKVDPEDERYQSFFGHTRYWDVIAVSQTSAGEETKEWVASFVHERDAEFICGIHGALPDLVRALHDAHDESDRADVLRDEANGLLAETLLENEALVNQLHELERQLNG